MKYVLRNQRAANIILSVILAVLLECYIVLVENSNLVFEFSIHDFIVLFSFKEFLVFFVIFLIVFYFIIDKNRRAKTLDFIYTYRLPIAFIVLIMAVLFQIHGSSINELNFFHVNHKPLFGVSRPIRSDEYAINTLFAFSQYMNGFGYFSEIVRGSLTDMFIIYGQPVLDIGMIFRPFLIGYLFLNQGQGLSFFWMARLIFLFLVSFEFGMLLTNKNKNLSLAYTLLVTFSPQVQWWFAINGLVEMLIFGQLGVLLINWYMTTEDYIKRTIIGFGLMVSAGTYGLVFYPSWQIPFAYVFLGLGIWIFFKRKHEFKFNKNDLVIIIFYLIVFSIVMVHILTNSSETLRIIMNTVYPSQLFNGCGSLNMYLRYIPSIFYPLDQMNFIENVCESVSFVDFFPIPLILSGIVLLYQKTKDKLLIGLLALYAILSIFYLVYLPDLIVTVTLRNHASSRLCSSISFVGILILIRSLSNLKELKNKKFVLIFSFILSIVMVYLSTFEFSSYYLFWMPIILIIFYFIFFSSCFLASSKRNQNIFLICIIGLSFLTGAFVNPIDYGTDVIYENPFLNDVDKIVEDNPNAIWIVQNLTGAYLIPTGAKTINSPNTYPDLEKWEKIDVNNESSDTYNRYANILFEIQNKNKTYFELMRPDAFTVHINVNDLEKLNVSYITTYDDLNYLSNENVQFNEIYDDYGMRIYHIKYT